MTAPVRYPHGVQVRVGSDTWGLQSALERRGLSPVAGVDEAGRGACAGPLVLAACVLPRRSVQRRWTDGGDAHALAGLTDSKLLSPTRREQLDVVIRRRAVSLCVVAFSAQEVDRLGVHVCNIEGMRRAVAGLRRHPGYVLTDGFAVPGLTAPSAPVIKGDRASACVAAASILAKVARDRAMVELHARHPEYGFAAHKGYSTDEHMRALRRYGPCAQHRHSYANVAALAIGAGTRSGEGSGPR